MKAFSKIVQRHFNLEPEMQLLKLTSEDVPEWDSMNFLLLVADIEKEYNISFTMDEVLSMKSLGQIRDIIQSRGESL